MKKFFAALLMLGAFNSYAGIQVDATRVIYKGDDKSASLPIHNDASEAYMVQTWLDTGDRNQVPKNLPVVVVPPILKLTPLKLQFCALSIPVRVYLRIKKLCCGLTCRKFHRHRSRKTCFRLRCVPESNFLPAGGVENDAGRASTKLALAA